MSDNDDIDIESLFDESNEEENVVVESESEGEEEAEENNHDDEEEEEVSSNFPYPNLSLFINPDRVREDYRHCIDDGFIKNIYYQFSQPKQERLSLPKHVESKKPEVKKNVEPVVEKEEDDETINQKVVYMEKIDKLIDAAKDNKKYLQKEVTQNNSLNEIKYEYFRLSRSLKFESKKELTKYGAYYLLGHGVEFVTYNYLGKKGMEGWSDEWLEILEKECSVEISEIAEMFSSPKFDNPFFTIISKFLTKGFFHYKWKSKQLEKNENENPINTSVSGPTSNFYV